MHLPNFWICQSTEVAWKLWESFLGIREGKLSTLTGLPVKAGRTIKPAGMSQRRVIWHLLFQLEQGWVWEWPARTEIVTKGSYRGRTWAVPWRMCRTQSIKVPYGQTQDQAWEEIRANPLRGHLEYIRDLQGSLIQQIKTPGSFFAHGPSSYPCLRCVFSWSHSSK